MRTMNHTGASDVRARIWFAALALLACLLFPAARAESDGMLRVNLARLGTPASIQLRADCDYLLATDLTTRIPAGTDVTVSAAGSSLMLDFGNRSLPLGASAQLVRAETGNHGAQFVSPGLSNRFCGDLQFSASSGVITTVLRIYVEDYLYGVVGYEMSPSSGLEALKAQAVVARNYALRQKASRSGSAYDLSDTGDALSFKGYNGASEYADAVRAVDATRGQVLYYGDSMATCYWCDSNGGQIESSANALGASLPYSEVRDDPYDYEGAGAKKTATLRRDCQALGDALTKALLSGVAEQLKRQGVEAEPDGIKLRAIEDILPGEARFAPPSRLYASLQFRLSVSVTAKSETRDGQMTVSVPTYGGLEDWYELGINDGDNETVWISEADRAFEITFRRKGSGVGMSRRGAQVMARRGLSCWDILEYYYPGVSLRQLSLTADGADDGARTTPAAEPIARARLSQKARLYRQANDAAGVLTTLPAGANVDVFAVQADWAAIGSGGLYGFIDTDALSSFALTGVTAAQVKEETFASIGDKFVDVLQLPVESAKVLAKLSSGDIVRLNAYTDSWALVTAPGDVEGFIPRNALTLRADDAEDDGEIVTVDGEMTALLTGNAGLYVNADASVAPRRVLPKGSYLSVLAYNRVWAYVRLQDDDTGYVKLDSLSAVEAPPEPKAAPEGEIVRVRGEQYRVVAADALPLFESYSTDSPVLAILEKGKRVQLGAYSADWACVRVDGILGFVRLSGLADAPETAASDGIEGGEITRVKGEAFAEVTSNSAVLYATWSTGSEALASPAKGDRVQVGAYNARWACVRYEGVTGFMLVQGLKLL